MPYIIGLNSGSSFDGVDAVLCKIDFAPDGHPSRPSFVDGLTVDWPNDLQAQVLSAFSNSLTIFELCRLNYAAGALYAEAANTLIKKAGLKAEDIEVIGYDGQTVYQEPPEKDLMAKYTQDSTAGLVERWTKGGFPCGLFIAESGVVAALTQVTTVTQFRPVDHALGGSAAPLMQYLDFVAFRDHAPIATLNIGGIANVQLAHTDRRQMMAFDTGPGNVMLDHVVKARTGALYDKDGDLAAKGEILPALLERLHTHPFFKRTPPRSAWRLDFGADFADDILAQHQTASTEDLVATLTAFTAESIRKSVVDIVMKKSPIKQLVASGGGTRNKTLLGWLSDLMAKHGVEVVLSDAYGLPATYKEAIKFATLGFAMRNQLANNIPAAGGASSYAILGKLSWAPRLAKNAGPLDKV
ncbi:hypothetical protein M406DRAFT_70239 [Cryphonectria parasitica EP155]|uniref:Anhydro-N-acetylmuramic acid kinase n=1 Tax=Cryphonectria parasitica (strain ATCC 38755 / EP155) TaxID=660469 RepID=A0A9P4Y7Z6_CRYP1|nr:uncharacterized protein M406DRAFT_70239 [Cryphonectria parasitica EP155]KAF3768145.1 hypothetical protein M406DRAFT_70239 [Cryphonectria parasitica EP155]